jgi:hypothetical protein
MMSRLGPSASTFYTMGGKWEPCKAAPFSARCLLPLICVVCSAGGCSHSYRSHLPSAHPCAAARWIHSYHVQPLLPISVRLHPFASHRPTAFFSFRLIPLLRPAICNRYGFSLEARWGMRRFIGVYTITAIGATFFSCICAPATVRVLCID